MVSTIDSYIDGTKYLQLDDTQFSSFNGFNISSDKRLKDNIEDVEDDTINMVKNIKIKTFVKNQKPEKLIKDGLLKMFNNTQILNIIL